MTASRKVRLEPSSDRTHAALAALETVSGRERMKKYLASLTSPSGAPELSVDDLVRALRQVRRVL